MDPQEIRSFRARMGWTQRDLASALDVSPTAVALWETGKREPNRANEVLLGKLIENQPSDPAISKELIFGGLAALLVYLMAKK
jgi:DNA-binding transcriptional regulator YiaG